jgi:hypothetical protein
MSRLRPHWHAYFLSACPAAQLLRLSNLLHGLIFPRNAFPQESSRLSGMIFVPDQRDVELATLE